MKVNVRLVNKDNWRTMMRIERALPKHVSGELKDTAEAIVTDIKSSWSGFYPPPSAPGEAPAERTGNLNDSVKVEGQGRTELGRFDASWVISIDTSNHPDGRKQQYAQALEDPFYLNRPFFINVVIERGIHYMESEFKGGRIFRG